jgi:ATP adenylyltransferase
MNKYPYSNGHIMIVPKRHLANVMDLSPEERLEMMDLLALGEQALKQALDAHGINAGFNLGQSAGAGIPGHLHLHLVPRWQNDVNFMTALADVRIIPEHLDATYHKLKTQVAHMGAGGAPR